jgi:hypothetical protein
MLTIKSTQRAFSANGRRVDGIIATINALGGSMSTPEETNKDIYNQEDTEFTSNKSINNYERSRENALKFTSLKLKNKMSKCELSTKKRFYAAYFVALKTAKINKEAFDTVNDIMNYLEIIVIQIGIPLKK